MIRNSLIIVLSFALLLVVTAQVQSDPQSGGVAVLADVTEGAEYVGEAKCKKCHFKQHRSWKKNQTYKHQNAFDTLKPKLTAADQKDSKGRLCVACHTTGHGGNKGFVDEASSGHLLGVQCEACHGPGSNHVKAGEQLKAEKRKKFNEGEKTYINKNVTSCASCHNPHEPHDK